MISVVPASTMYLSVTYHSVIAHSRLAITKIAYVIRICDHYIFLMTPLNIIRGDSRLPFWTVAMPALQRRQTVFHIFPTHSCGRRVYGHHASCSHLSLSARYRHVRFGINFRNLRNVAPCSGVVCISAHMPPVGQNSMRSCLARTLSVTKKYRMFNCRVRLVLDCCLLFSNRIEL